MQLFQRGFAMFSKTFTKPTKTQIFRFAVLMTAYAFCVFSVAFFAVQKEWSKAGMSVLSLFYVSIPEIAQKLFKFRIQTPLYVVVMIYTICPLLGYSYNFYYNVRYWDKILHAFGGLIFAMLGVYLPMVLSKGKNCNVLLCAVFGFFFSVAIAGLWEFCEYAMDTLFHTDMQKDRWITEIRSYLLGVEVDEIGVLDGIETVIVNGQTWNGYLDIGLIDTMGDMLLETVGAAVYITIYAIGKGKRFTFEAVRPAKAAEEQPPVLESEAALSDAETTQE